MSNSWSYTLVLTESQIPMQELFEQVIALANEHGYALQFPVYIITNDPPWTLQFWEAKPLTAFICEHGGTVPVWCDGEDIGLDFDVVQRQISLSVLHDLRLERDYQKAHDLGQLFTDLCGQLHPQYGYSCDEWHTETAVGSSHILAIWKQFRESITARQAPVLLFWLNYFARDYLSNLGPTWLEQIPRHELVRSEHGVFVYLAHVPWEARLAVLESDGKYHVR